MKRQYTGLLVPDREDGGYVVRVPTLPGCHTQGDTIEEALENARDAIGLYLEDLEAGGEVIPEEVEPPSLVALEI
jgi:predicted RNase H-like HicB family nuclease